MRWIAHKILTLLSPKYAKNWARHIVGAIASALITAGYFDKGLIEQWVGPAEQAVAGIIILLIVIATSIGNTEKLEGERVVIKK